MNSGASEKSSDSSTADLPLRGRRICLVFDYSLSHYSRLLTEIDALQRVGATVVWLTQHPSEDGPDDVLRIYTPAQGSSRLGGSSLGARMTRRASRVGSGMLPRAGRALLGLMPYPTTRRQRRQVLDRLATEVDVFWVIDFPRLGEVLAAARRSGVRVVYETLDLVPEYRQHGPAHRARSLAEERRLIGLVDGFITACDSYADYYMETYGPSILRRRPFVRDNMPAEIVGQISPTRRPLRILFLGSLMFDRPVMELVDAVAATRAPVTFTIQGKDYLGESARRELAERLQAPELRHRVRVVDPCPPQAIVATASEYDVGVVALRGVDENERRASTGKLFTYMAAGLAILGSDLPGVARVVRRHKNGVLVDGMDPQRWASAIDKLAAMPPTQVDELKNRSLAAAELYSWDKQEPDFVGVFAQALGASPHVP